MNNSYLRWAVFGLTIALLTSFSARGQATVLKDLALSDLTTEADVILIGTVGEGRSLREASKIWTDTTISVERVIKGKGVVGRMTLRQQGGRLGDEVMHTDGNAHLTKGERALFFLKVRGGLSYTVGMELGKFEIYAGPANKDRVRRTSTVPVARKVESTSAMELSDASSIYNGETLETILGDIKALMTKGSSRKLQR